MLLALSGIISDDYTKTMVLVYADVGASQNKIIDLEDLINNELEALSTPAGVNARVSGTPSIISTILDLLKQDAIFTIVLASIIILILLFIIERSITRGLLIFIPILLGLTWTLGTMGFADIQISVATAGLGAMILGLGTEYGVFMLTRYTEERSKGKTQAEAVKTAVPSVGASVMGSGTTTIVGFLALTLSIMPMLQNLGKSLALGILYCIIASVIVEPLLIMEEEKLHHKFTQRRYKKALEQKRRLDSNGGAR